MSSRRPAVTESKWLSRAKGILDTKKRREDGAAERLRGRMSESKWLVKSSGKILGPWTLDEIADQIRARQYSIFDEVREPRSRWMIMREHPHLAQVVRQIRDEHANVMESTQSTFVTSGKTVTSSVTERILEENTVTPHPMGDEDGLTSVQGQDKTIQSGAFGGGKAFGTLGDQNVQSRLQRARSQWMLAIYALGFCFVLGAFFVWKNQRPAKMSNEQADEYFRLAADLASRGEYNHSFEMIEKIDQSRSLSAQESLLKIKLLLSMDGASAIDLARAIDGLGKEAVNLSVNPDLLRGLTQARLGRYKDAIGFYQRVLRKSPQNEEAQLNMAASNYMLGENQKAFNLLKAPRFGRARSFYHMLKALVALKLDDKMARSQVMDEFKSFDSADARERDRENGHEFFFERVLLMGSLAQSLGLGRQADDWRKKLVQSNPFETRMYLKTPLLDWQTFEWKGFLHACEAMKNSVPDTGLIRGVWSLCLAASGNLVDGLNVIDQGMKQYAGDTSLIAVSSLLLFQADRKNEAEIVTRTYPVSDRILINWIRGLLCEEKIDNTCSERAWEQVRGLDSNEPRAYYGLAKASKDLGNDSQYISISNMGIKVGPSYKPLLQLTGGRYEF